VLPNPHFPASSPRSSEVNWQSHGTSLERSTLDLRGHRCLGCGRYHSRRLYSRGLYGTSSLLPVRRSPVSNERQKLRKFIFQTLAVNAIPPFRSRFIAYGARASIKPGSQETSPSTTKSHARESSSLLDKLAGWTVPHKYFLHFYILSTLSSVFWITQVLTGGPAFRWVAAWVEDPYQSKSMSLGQVLLCCILMAVQGVRRLWESVASSKSSTSQMWFVHWLIGLAFYFGVNLAIWIEGTGRRQVFYDSTLLCEALDPMLIFT
jgi:hypothetical protein